LHFTRKRQDGFSPNFFRGLEESTCLLQPALKSTAPGPLSFALKLEAFSLFLENAYFRKRSMATPGPNVVLIPPCVKPTTLYLSRLFGSISFSSISHCTVMYVILCKILLNFSPFCFSSWFLF